MGLILVVMVLYVILYFLAFIHVSKLNNSYINSWTISVANEIGVRMLPFLIMLRTYANYQAAIWRMAAVLYIGLLFRFIGYKVGHRKPLKIINKLMIEQNYARRRYRIYLVLSIAVGTFSFVILANRGSGLYNWIFNTRKSYITGRSGNGVWYILFQLMIATMTSLIFCISAKNMKGMLLFLIPLVAALFTGSKNIILGVAVVVVLYYDMYVRKIKTISLAIIGALMMGFLLLLLNIQGGTSLISYSDYYRNFILFLNRQIEVGWEYKFGQITFENFFWKMVPRAIYPNKPKIYGVVRIVAMFYPKSSILAGNTPAFSEHILSYADFGLIGVAVYRFIGKWVSGMLERCIRDHLKAGLRSFNVVFLYVVFFFIIPINFYFPYILIYYLVLVMLQRIKFVQKEPILWRA